MTHPARRHKGRMLRLKGHDYSQEGAYFVTICLQNRQCLFGSVVNQQMCPNPAGQMVARWWLELNRKFSALETDEYVVMPNHLHGVIFITDNTLPWCAAESTGEPNHATANGRARQSLPTVVQWFKTMTTNAYIQGVRSDGWAPFPGRLWQRSYHERIIRSYMALNRIRQYIKRNPAKWHREAPGRIPR